MGMMRLPWGDAVYPAHQSKTSRLPRLATWIVAAVLCSTGTPAVWEARAQQADKIPNETCLGCHGNEGFAIPDASGKMRSLHIIKDKFEQSVHGKRFCVDCHKQITAVPHPKLDHIVVSCVQCHQDLWAKAQQENKTEEFAELGVVVKQIDRYMKSIHARPRMEDQSLTNATCYNCHDPHYVYPKGSPIRAEWRLNIPNTCGKCHKSQLELYALSVHGKEVLQNHNPNAAICSDCHTTHDVESPKLASTRLVITQNCGSCHEQNLKSYLETYHGQVTKLGYAYTAKCFDCHGNHNIQPVSDPTSKVHPINRLQTCRQCHKDASPGFASFQPHATTADFFRYPVTWLASKFMLALLISVLVFFWTHSGLWWYREYRDRQAHKMRPHVLTSELLQGKDAVYYRRWPAMWRVAHLAFAIIVIALVFTGMTLFYADSFWAARVQNAFGGPRVTGIVHRTFAVAFVGIFFAHLVYVAFRIGAKWRNWKDWFGPYSMIPNWQDLKDVVAMFRWFLGMGPRPIFDRWTYWEKFDYWAPFWGVTIIGVSGAMLWFKDITAWVLPGWAFNVATIFHGEEAFLAAAFLFTVHFFNNHWRPDNFPLDILMFTGAMPLEKFKREHTLEFNRLVETGQLDKYLVEAPSRPMTLGSKVLGFTLMAAGLILFMLIMVGFARNLTGFAVGFAVLAAAVTLSILIVIGLTRPATEA
jgi:cytochrome b subunit of formate dehydrogenase